MEHDKTYFNKLCAQLPNGHAFNNDAVKFLTHVWNEYGMHACPIVWSWNFIDLFQDKSLVELMRAVLDYLPENGIWLCVQEYSHNRGLINHLLMMDKFDGFCPIVGMDGLDPTINFYHASVLESDEICNFLMTRYELRSIGTLENYVCQLSSLIDIAWFSKVSFIEDLLIKELSTVKQVQLKTAMIEEVIEPLIDSQRRITFLDQQSFFRVVELGVVSTPSTCCMNDDVGFKYFSPNGAEVVVNRGLFVLKKEKPFGNSVEQLHVNNPSVHGG